MALARAPGLGSIHDTPTRSAATGGAAAAGGAALGLG
eukprot:CAMPEP_0118874756 /NCGR_PEP_ID=MMETSP1163-20130328/16084_1 /TAXON_ID=124430 /ORGANISM="Phaeomonas parva, Strain CCMP2877" /LENGTH=36 /DNA_ID= /DNA_START= /DNA_END= /DNA_ORIENTATION=